MKRLHTTEDIHVCSVNVDRESDYLVFAGRRVYIPDECGRCIPCESMCLLSRMYLSTLASWRRNVVSTHMSECACVIALDVMQSM